MTVANFHDFPGLENGLPNSMTFHDQTAVCISVTRCIVQGSLCGMTRAPIMHQFWGLPHQLAHCTLPQWGQLVLHCSHQWTDEDQPLCKRAGTTDGDGDKHCKDGW